jgi:hypothetical protein
MSAMSQPGSEIPRSGLSTAPAVRFIFENGIDSSTDHAVSKEFGLQLRDELVCHPGKLLFSVSLPG